MWRERDEALPTERPTWAEVVDGFLLCAETGLVDPAEAKREMQKLYLGLFVGGEISDFGVLQAYLHEKHASLQLSAKPFDARAYPALACVDPVHGESRDYAVEIYQGAEIARLYDAPLPEGSTPLSHDVLKMILARDTGIVLPGMCVKLPVPLQLEV